MRNCQTMSVDSPGEETIFLDKVNNKITSLLV